MVSSPVDGKDLFDCCEALRKVTLTHIRWVAPMAFHACENLESVEFPEVRVLESWSLGRCPKLKEAILPRLVSVKDTSLFGCAEGLEFVIDVKDKFEFDASWEKIVHLVKSLEVATHKRGQMHGNEPTVHVIISDPTVKQ
jgi:hypothetical protein